MTNIDLLVKDFARISQELAINKDKVTDLILDGLGKGFLQGLTDEETAFLKRMIDSLR